MDAQRELHNVNPTVERSIEPGKQIESESSSL